jgi:hypothetical protein
MTDERFLREQRRWLRPDAHLWIRPDAHRFMPPGAPRHSGTDVVEYFWPEAKGGFDSLQNECKYGPDQPRVPGGQTGGGQWTSGGGGGGGGNVGSGSEGSEGPVPHNRRAWPFSDR